MGCADVWANGKTGATAPLLLLLPTVVLVVVAVRRVVVVDRGTFLERDAPAAGGCTPPPRIGLPHLFPSLPLPPSPSAPLSFLFVGGTRSEKEGETEEEEEAIVKRSGEGDAINVTSNPSTYGKIGKGALPEWAPVADTAMGVVELDRVRGVSW